MFEQHENLFGNIAIELFDLNSNHIGEALKMQEDFAIKGEQIPHIGEILINDGVLDEEKRELVLEKMSERGITSNKRMNSD